MSSKYIKVDVVRTATYKISENEIKKFKETVAEHLCESSCDENCCYTADDIPDTIVEDVIKKGVRAAYEEGYDSGFSFDDYFETVSLIMGEDGTNDCVLEAVDLVLKHKEAENNGKH